MCLVGGAVAALGEREAGVLASRVHAGRWCRSIAVATVLCAVGDFSTHSRQPLMKHLPIETTRSSAGDVAAVRP